MPFPEALFYHGLERAILLSSQAYFIRVLADYVNGRKTEQPPEDSKQLHSIARSQQLQSICYAQCRSFLPSQWEEEFAAILHRSVNRKFLSQKIAEALNAEKIPFAFVKGHEIEKLYTPVAMRTMGDTDIIIHPQDRQRAHSVMTDLGFQCAEMGESEWIYRQNGLCFEVHDCMLHPHKGNEQLVRFFNNLWSYGLERDGAFHLDWNFHFCYLIQHISGHVIMTGIGFRQFLDIVMVVKKVELNWDWIRNQLEKLGLKDFADICYALCERWFDFRFPFETPPLEEDFFQEATEKMFHDGVFGQENPGNKKLAGLVERQIYGGEKSTTGSKLSLLVEKLFPPYPTMRRLPYCQFLEGRRALLPIAWLWRWIYLLFVKRKGISEVKEQAQAMDTGLAKERVAYLRKWGL